MYDNIIAKMRERIRTRKYVLTVHANEEMENDHLTVFDLENCILTGKIIERQRDKNTAEWKYVVKGKCYSLKKDPMIVVGKISTTDKLVVLTVFPDQGGEPYDL